MLRRRTLGWACKPHLTMVKFGDKSRRGGPCARLRLHEFQAISRFCEAFLRFVSTLGRLAAYRLGSSRVNAVRPETGKARSHR